MSVMKLDWRRTAVWFVILSLTAAFWFGVFYMAMNIPEVKP